MGDTSLSHKSRLIVITAVMASLLEIIDTSIVNVAIPRMQGNLGVTLDEITWISTGYIISNAVILPIASWLADRIGRKAYFTGCILFFTFTSLLCGLAPNFVFLVIARVFQGLAGGALLPTSQALIQEQFVGERSGIGSAIYGMSVMVGPALGPTLGGYLTDNYEWRSIFFINLPIGLIASVLSFFVIDDIPSSSLQKHSSKIDFFGFILLVLGIGCLQFVLERGEADDWFSSNLILFNSVLAGVALPWFVAWEYRHPSPMVNIRLFHHSAVRSGTLLMAATGVILYAVIFLLPVYTDKIIGMDATQTGILYIPGSLATIATMPIVGRFLSKWGAKPFILLGIVFVCISLYQLSIFTSIVGADDIYWPLIIRGIGLGCIFVPINSAVLGQFRGEELGQVAGLLNLSRQIGGSIGIAAIATYLDRFSAQFRNDLRPYVSSVRLPSINALSETQSLLGGKLNQLVGSNLGSIGFTKETMGGLKSIMGRVEEQVFQLSFNRLMICLFVVYLLSVIPLYRMKLPHKITGPISTH
jgi:DHA2 family multidrug resistance protein